MAISSGLKVGVVICSTRTPRIGPSVVKYITDTIAARGKTPIEYVPVDVAEFNLPIFDESILPAMVPDKAEYSKDHSKKWSAEMKKYNGYIWVTPEYNYGIPASTKNAVDFLYNEIKAKPAVVVGYGIMGGKNSSSSLVTTLEGMKLNVISVKPNLPFAGAQGPDLFAAVAGSLGTDTLALWEKEYNSVIISAVEELETKLETAA